MMNLIDHFAIRDRVDPMKVAAMCQHVENHVCKALSLCGIMDQATSCAGRGEFLHANGLPASRASIAVEITGESACHVIGINSNVKHSVGGGQYGITAAAPRSWAHAIILYKMRQKSGQNPAGKKLEPGDPMNGYLANLDLEDYKRNISANYLPESMLRQDFLRKIQRHDRQRQPPCSRM